MSTLSRKAALQYANQQLQRLENARLDAEILLTHVLNISRSQLYAWSEKQLSEQQWQQFQELVKKRSQHQPIAYLVGNKEFWSLNLHVNTSTLIPRPETELLVEQALNHLPQIEQPIILDLGTGSGAIALALARECPHAKIIAVDINPKTLATAKYNAEKLRCTNVKFYLSHWFQNLPRLKAHLIVSNPPYIASDDPHLKQGDVQFEPLQALISGMDGLDDIQQISACSQNFLFMNGILLFEHGYNQAIAVQQILLAQNYQNVQTINDLSGLARVSLGMKK